MKRVNILTYADGNYMQHACIMILSLFDVVDSGRKYTVLVYYSTCDPMTLEKFKKSIDKPIPTNVTCQLIECDYQMESRLKAKDDHLSAAIYNKLFIYNDLPWDLEKVLFLDADIVLLKDPAAIYDLKLDERMLAAVREPVFEILPESVQKTIRVEVKNYFNSGVMLVNLPKWKAEQIGERSLEFCIEKWEDTPYHDQDAFNHIINGNWLEISPLWNPRIKNHVEDSTGTKNELSRLEVYRKNLAYLVHYSGPAKPWFYMSFHPQKKLYLDYLEQSEFRDYQFPDYSTENLIKRQILKVRRAIYFFQNRIRQAGS